MPIVSLLKDDLVEMATKAMESQKDFVWFAHGANCKKAMASGIAKQIAKKIPAVKEIDDLANAELGFYSVYTNGKVSFLNMYTQFETGANASYDAVYDSFKRLNAHYKSTKILRWAGGFNDTPERLFIPMIGCGIGGLKWEPTKAIIDAATPDLPITLVEYSGA